MRWWKGLCVCVMTALLAMGVDGAPEEQRTRELAEAKQEYERRMAEVRAIERHALQQLNAVAVSLETGEMTDPHVAAALAGVPVYDAANFAQNLIQYAEVVYQTWQQAQQMANEALMLYNQARNLASFGHDIKFREGLHVAEFLFDQGEKLAALLGGWEYAGLSYAAEEMEREVANTWRGFVPLLNRVDVRTLEHGDVALETPQAVKIFETERVARNLNRTMGRLNRYHAEFVRSNLDLKTMKESMASSDGERQALEDLAAMTAASAEQMSLLIGVMTLDVGAQTAVEADRYNAELEALATGLRMVEAGRAQLALEHGTDLPVHTGSRPQAMTGLPSWY